MNFVGVNKQDQDVNSLSGTVGAISSAPGVNKEAEGEDNTASDSSKWWGRARVTISEEYRNQILFDSMETLVSIVDICHSRSARLIKMVNVHPCWKST